jgi:hypothetical protein
MTGRAWSTSDADSLNLERRAFLDLIRLANALADPKAIARQLAVLAHKLSDCEAVAIRLKEGPGFPYAANLGFPDHFLALENDLCATDEGGHLLRDKHRQPILACLCGRVLSGQVDRQQTFFTDRGSFITASTSNLLASHLEPECLGRTRNQCHAAGYETVGLFPIRRDDVTYGLIQCNDPRPGLLTAVVVDLMENLADSAAHLLQLAMA